MVPDASELDAVMRYHERTKHHFNPFAPGPASSTGRTSPIRSGATRARCRARR